MKNMTSKGSSLSLKDLLDISALQDLSDSFTRLTGITLAILDLKGEVLTASGWRKICTEFHRKNPVTAARCLESDTLLASQSAKSERYNIYQCKNGLVDVAVPIVIETTHVGNLFIGQFFFEPPDLDFFARQAETFGFDKASYFEALARVPIFTLEKVEQAMDYLSHLTVIIGGIGKDKKKLFELNRDLEQRIRERTADLRKEIWNRKKTEIELQASKRFLDSVFNAIQDGISVLDKDMNVLQVNNIMYEWYPQLRESLGEKCYKIYHGRSKPCRICPAIQAFKSNKMEMAEVPFTLDNTVIGTQELFSFPLRDSAGQVQGIVEYVRDISERKRIEEQIRMEKNFSESLINSLPGVMYVFDRTGHFFRWNKNFEIISGYSADEIRRMSPLDFIAPKDRGRVGKAIEKVFLEGTSHIEADCLTAGQQTIPYLFTGFRLLQDGLNYLVGIGLDISDRVGTEREKEQLIKKLQETLSQVKQLSGMLPICASCKKIRDDKGYWNQIESYIRQHSEADFSHGLCPECARRLYPDFFDTKKSR